MSRKAVALPPNECPIEMPSQPPRLCVFCNAPGGSREHALPRWLALTMGLSNEPTQPGLISSHSGIVLGGNPRATGSLITKEICHTCNTGWMAELEAHVQPFLAPLVSPNRITFGRECLEPLNDVFGLLARWLLKTAVTLERTTPKGQMEKIPLNTASWAKQDQLPPSLKLYAGWIESAGFQYQQGRGFRILNGGIFHGNQIHTESLNLVIQLNHLALHLVNAPGAEWFLPGCSDRHGQDCVPCFIGRGPLPGNLFGSSCLFRSFHEFANAAILWTGSQPQTLDPREELKMQHSLRCLIPTEPLTNNNTEIP